MNAYYAGPGYRPPAPRSGINPAVAVLLWIFIGWPLSWLLLVLLVPLGILFGIAVTIAMIVVVSNGGGRSQQVAVWMPPTFPPPVPPPSPAAERQQAIRNEVESLAVVTVVGSCGWCGSLAAHVNDDGHPIPPRHWHAVEIEERVRAKLRY